MKNIVMAFGFLLVAIFVAASIASIETDSNKEQMLTENVRTAIYQTMKECSENTTWLGVYNKYAGEEIEVREGFTKEDEILVLRFKENLKALMNTADDIKVRILAADQKDGLFSVEVEQTYSNWGIRRKTTTKETVIRNDM